VQRADQVLVLPLQLVQCGPRLHRGHLLADQPRIRSHAGRAVLGHPHDLAVRVDLVHEPGRRGDPVGRELAVHGHGHHQLGPVDAERDDRGPPGRDRAAAYLAQRGGHPDLVLLLQGQDGGQAPAELARREDPGRVPDLEPRQLTVLAVHGFSTRTPASSRCTPASASSTAAISNGSLASSAGRAAASQRLLTPSECRTTAEPGGALYSNWRMVLAWRPAMPGMESMLLRCPSDTTEAATLPRP